MCGIVGAVAQRDVAEILVEGLRRLEYRGYDSAGVAVFSANQPLQRVRRLGKVAELVGRLSAIQGDCASAEVHRRMSEIYGEREGTRRMTNMVIQSQASWGAVERVEKGKRVIRFAPTTINNDELTAWLVEAALRYAGKPVSVSSLQSLPVLFPFSLTRPLGYVLSNCPILDLRSEGPSNQFVALRQR